MSWSFESFEYPVMPSYNGVSVLPEFIIQPQGKGPARTCLHLALRSTSFMALVWVSAAFTQLVDMLESAR